MAKPKKSLKSKEFSQNVDFLYQSLGKLNDSEKIKIFFKDLLTASELRMLKKRWHIACLLAEGGNLREIARKAQASTQTVIRIKKLLGESNGGLKLALGRTKKRGETTPVSEMSPPEALAKHSEHQWVFGRTKET